MCSKFRDHDSTITGGENHDTGSRVGIPVFEIYSSTYIPGKLVGKLNTRTQYSSIAILLEYSTGPPHGHYIRPRATAKIALLSFPFEVTPTQACL